MRGPTPEEIARILLADVEAARERLRIASEDFQNVLDDVPSASPHSNGSFPLEHNGNAKQQALNHLRIATERHTAFVLYGIVPEDLQE